MCREALADNKEQFIQYLLMTPTYINILNVYAFCNTHDITWGTKGDDKPEKLPSATTKPGGKVDVSIPSDDHDLNTQYELELRIFATKYAPPKKVPGEQEKQEDYYKGFRSAVVLAWMFCNMALAAVVLNTIGWSDGNDRDKGRVERSTIYMAVVLWSVAGLSAFRFVGAMWFLVVRLVSALSRRSCVGSNADTLYSSVECERFAMLLCAAILRYSV